MIKVENGDQFVTTYYFSCDKCNKEIYEAWPHYSFDNNTKHLCVDCAFIEGKISEKEYLECVGIHSNGFYVEVVDGNISIFHGKKVKSNKQGRHNARYEAWRKSVFERDNYTCQICSQRGGELNAHHIQTYAKFKKLRYVLDNGITLCKKCHRETHKKKVS